MLYSYLNNKKHISFFDFTNKNYILFINVYNKDGKTKKLILEFIKSRLSLQKIKNKNISFLDFKIDIN